MNFDFGTAGRILFGEGSSRAAVPAARAMGSRALLVTGRSSERAQGLRASLESGGVPTIAFSVESEPTVDLVRCGTALARQKGADLVIAAGGGSAIDAGKAIAALLANPGDVLDYLEVVGRGQTLKEPSVPFIALPTTAGTGTEVTRNAVLASPEHGVKASLRSAHMLPRMAIIDPELTYELPPAVTASTGLDALTQLIEPYVSSRANAMTDMFCVEGMRRAAGALVRAYENGADREARRDMCLASLLGGLSLANAGLGAVHGFAAPVGGEFPAPHGAVCAALLPHVIETNLRALRSRVPQSPAIARYETVARILTGDLQAAAEDAVGWVRIVCARLKIPPLGSYGITEADVPDLVEKAARASSMKANPIVLETGELTGILTAAL